MHVTGQEQVDALRNASHSEPRLAHQLRPGKSRRQIERMVGDQYLENVGLERAEPLLDILAVPKELP